MYNSTQLQGINTTVCGHYCIIFALLRSREFSMREIISSMMIIDDTHTRDHLIGIYINTAYVNFIEANGIVSSIHVQSSKVFCHYSVFNKG